MTDVRLTATNPEDSSVVPVACNSRGELLVTDPVIEQIDNDVTINGTFTSTVPSVDEGMGPDIITLNSSTTSGIWFRSNESVVFNVARSGYAFIDRRASGEEWGGVRMNTNSLGLAVYDNENRNQWKVNYNGVVTAPEVLIALGSNNPANYTTTTTEGEQVGEYTGPVMNVREELEFLRAQVRALMEKLKMTPEGGWPVWDGSAET